MTRAARDARGPAAVLGRCFRAPAPDPLPLPLEQPGSRLDLDRHREHDQLQPAAAGHYTFEIEAAIADGTVADQVHAISPKKGDSIFIESGRLHAIGAGFLIHEIQQNSDTTYRVFDWNRTDSEGKPRQLHVGQSLACIDFSDTEPGMDKPDGNILAECPFFKTTLHHLAPGETISNPDPERFSLITVVSGKLEGKFTTGQTVLLPRGHESLSASEATSALQITIPG